MPPVDDTRPPTHLRPVPDHPYPPPKLDVVVYGIKAATVTVSGISCAHGDYETLELGFGPDTTVTFAGESVDDLARLARAISRALAA